MEHLCKLHFLKVSNQVSYLHGSVMHCISVTSYFFTQGFTELLAFKFDKCRAERQHNQVKSVISANDQDIFPYFAFGLFSVTCKTKQPLLSFFIVTDSTLFCCCCWISLSHIL